MNTNFNSLFCNDDHAAQLFDGVLLMLDTLDKCSAEKCDECGEQKPQECDEECVNDLDCWVSLADRLLGAQLAANMVSMKYGYTIEKPGDKYELMKLSDREKDCGDIINTFLLLCGKYMKTPVNIPGKDVEIVTSSERSYARLVDVQEQPDITGNRLIAVDTEE